ncbi:hypothetical protein N7462_008972 [Penicillium macrosclerotiorum]|uniref:uncharacterized protein n=1 Tax=Penicillium macrosclerotiorum TaxID=303699 RepID=UPI0025480E71|nr:uncharacterized protein N7462_008972 [Penicillium macrosclerotiorum]KAJ5676075.1 hypothetical protein N7462_008972 [Penicillium macrosclerotiorum]
MTSNTEIEDADNVSDSDSLASTADSEMQSEYEVETILAEEVTANTREIRYLVKWAGYPLHRASLEPAENFDSDITLVEWEKKKCNIQAGNETAFDLINWKRDIAAREKETQQRKQARRFKRAERAVRLSRALFSPEIEEFSQPKENESIQNDSPSEARLSNAPSDHDRADSSSSIASNRTPLFVSSETPQTSGKVQLSTSPGQGTPAVGNPSQPRSSSPPPGEVPQSSEAPRAESRRQANSKDSEGCQRPPKQSDVKQTQSTKQPPQKPAEAPLFATFGANQTVQNRGSTSKFATRWGDREPTRSQVSLMKPSEFSERTTGASFSKFNLPITTSNAFAPSESPREAAPAVSEAAPLFPSETRAPLRVATAMSESQGRKQKPQEQVSHRDSLSFRGDCYRPRESGNGSFRQRSEFRRGSNSPERRRRSPSPYERARSPRGQLRSRSPRGRFFASDTYSPSDSFNLPDSSRQFRSSSTYDSHTPDKRRPLTSTSVREKMAPSKPLPPKESAPSSIEPALSESAKIAQMPTGTPEEGATKTTNGYFFNKHEVLAHVFFGPERKFIGVARLCGITKEIKLDLLASKASMRKGRPFEMWFRDLFSLGEYTELCNVAASFDESNILWCTSWMEGFEDSNPGIFHMTEYLFKANRMAVYYPETNGNAWLAYSLKSSDFSFLTRGEARVPFGVPIRLGVRVPLPPPKYLTDRHMNPTNLGPRNQSGSAVHSPIDRANPSALGGVTQAAGTETSNPRDPNQPARVVTDPRLRHRPFLATASAQGNEPEQSDAMDITPDVPHLVDNSNLSSFTGNQNDALPASHNPEAIIKSFFQDQLHITFKELATILSSRDKSPADMFYLHFPDEEEARMERNILEKWLQKHGVVVWSDWAKFIKNSKGGVTLFHESFRDYHTLEPAIRDVLRNPEMGFWTCRLSRPLELPDLRYCQSGAHFQRILSRGGAYLITDDLLEHDVERAAVIMAWMYEILRKNGPGDWKMFIRPDIMAYLEERLNNPRRDKGQDKHLVNLILAIMKCNSMDKKFPHFRPESLDPSRLDESNSNVVSIPLAGYGSRSENAAFHIPRGLTQAERNADHLVEAFAGWTLIYAARFRKTTVISNVDNPLLLSHWSSWRHAFHYSAKAFISRGRIDETVVLDRLHRTRMPATQKSGKNDLPSSPMTQTPRTPSALSIGIPTPREPPKELQANAPTAPKTGEWKQPRKHNYPTPYR